jgi:PAS domain S-box-containing protein
MPPMQPTSLDAERLFESLLRTAPIGVAFVDPELRYLRINDELAAMNGAAAEAHLGRRVREMVPALAAALEPLLRRVLASGEPIVEYELSGETAAAPGERREWLESYYPVRDGDGRVAAVQVVVREVTAQRRAERARDQAEEQQRLLAEALDAVRLRDEFLSIAAHELRTPLTTVRTQAQLLLRRLHREARLDPLQAARALQAIDKQSERLNRLISQLLDVSRLQALRLQIERQDVDLAELIQAVVADARLRSEGRPIEAQLPGSLPARVDPLRLEQVLNNLLDNADKYSPPGTPIEVSAVVGSLLLDDSESSVSPPPDSRDPIPLIVVAVRDYGPGVPPEKRQQIFDRFYQAHTRTRSGMGLGLYISRQIVELHGGALRAEFPEDGGSRFVISLPVDGQPDASIIGSEARLTGTRPGGS